MKATEHPEYQEEKVYLDRTIASIDAKIASIGSMPGSAGDPYAQEIVRKILRGKLESLRAVRSSPYFGRIDFLDAESEHEKTFYIGKIGIEGSSINEIVIDWRAPVASLFYSGEVLLKRQLVIADAQLKAISDEVDRRPVRPPEVVPIIAPDAYLREVLSGKRDAQLRDIVTTIQAQQNAIIRASHDQVMLIQGVAGSGKTVVALHRLAYLFYPGNKIDIKPDRVIIFGPNRIFLQYIEQVLPDLNVQRTAQTTFQDWALKQIGLSDYMIREDSLEELYAPSTSVEKKELLRRRGKLKNSLRMARVLRQYMEARRKAFEIPETGFEFSGVGPLDVTLRVNREDIAQAYQDSLNAPLHVLQRRVIDRIGSLLDRQYELAIQQKIKEAGQDLRERAAGFLQQATALNTLAEKFALDDLSEKDTAADNEDDDIARNLRRGAKALRQAAARFQDQSRQAVERALNLQNEALDVDGRRGVMAELRSRVEQEVLSRWSRMSLPGDYYDLLSQPMLLQEAGIGILSDEDLTLLQQDPPPRGQLETEDIAPLYYFNMALNGVPRVKYDHVVIDEAQDMSELQLMILKQHVPGGSITILGDTAQKIFSHRSVNSWEDIGQIFNEWDLRYEEIAVSYRSTFEITMFANELLKRIPGGGSQPIAKPFDRHGPQPVLAQNRRLEDMVAAIGQTIQSIQKDGFKTIAIICKTIRQGMNLAAAFHGQGITDFGVVEDTDFDYRGGVVVIPAYLTKGLEFDVAIVVNVDHKTYANTEDDARLLYVAITRPLHQLYLFWVGEISPLLDYAVSQSER